MALTIIPLTIQKLRHGAGFTADGVRAPDAVLDPFLMIDHYRMSEPTFGAHPHAGFCAVTYMFDGAETGFINHDSLGAPALIHPGDAHWSVAGLGIVHDEVPIKTGQTAHGLQLFVNLPAAVELQAARALHFDQAQMPRLQTPDGAQVKLAFGRFGAIVHPENNELPYQVSLLDVRLPSNANRTSPTSFKHRLGSNNAILLPISGALSLDGQTLSGPVALRGDVLFTIEATEPNAGQTEAHFVLLEGQPIGEPVFRHGPFALSSPARLQDAIARYQRGEFGQLQAK